MATTASLSYSPPMHSFSLYNNSNKKPFLSQQSHSLSAQSKRFHVTPPPPHSVSVSAALNLHSLSLSSGLARFSIAEKRITVKKNMQRKSGIVCYSRALTHPNLQWISTISAVVLMFAKGTAVPKSFIVPLFALQAPSSIISWIKGEYGVWAAFLAILVRLFFFIPAELELPFVALLLVIVAPHQLMRFRGTQEGHIISLVIAGYLAFQHFSRAGSLRNGFEQGSLVATIAIIGITAVSCLLLI